MTALGWIFMLVSVGGVTILTAWCFYRVLGAPPEAETKIKDFHSA